jgi:phage regulator Rha-like protein
VELKVADVADSRQHVHILQQIRKNGCFMQKFPLRVEEF